MYIQIDIMRRVAACVCVCLVGGYYIRVEWINESSYPRIGTG